MWLDVVVVFANLNELFEHRRGEVGNSELAPSGGKLELVGASKSEMLLVDFMHALQRNDPDCIDRLTRLLVPQAVSLDQAYDNTES